MYAGSISDGISTVPIDTPSGDNTDQLAPWPTDHDVKFAHIEEDCHDRHDLERWCKVIPRPGMRARAWQSTKTPIGGWPT